MFSQRKCITYAHTHTYEQHISYRRWVRHRPRDRLQIYTQQGHEPRTRTSMSLSVATHAKELQNWSHTHTAIDKQRTYCTWARPQMLRITVSITVVEEILFRPIALMYSLQLVWNSCRRIVESRGKILMVSVQQQCPVSRIVWPKNLSTYKKRFGRAENIKQYVPLHTLSRI